MTQMNDLNKSIHANQKSEKSRKDETYALSFYYGLRFFILIVIDFIL